MLFFDEDGNRIPFLNIWCLNGAVYARCIEGSPKKDVVPTDGLKRRFVYLHLCTFLPLKFDCI